MIISRGRNYIFVHVPKTGGTSLALALEERAMKDDLMLGDTPKALKRRRKLKDVKAAGRLWKHASLADVDGLVSREEVAQMFTFTLVRNPWDRMVSYYHWLQVQTFEHVAVQLAKTTDFAGFVQARDTQESFRNWPASRYMQGVDGQEHCSLYIRLEHFSQDAQPLFEHLGFELAMPHANRSKRSVQVGHYYSKELVKIVAEVCSADIEQFGYEFPFSE